MVFPVCWSKPTTTAAVIDVVIDNLGKTGSLRWGIHLLEQPGKKVHAQKCDMRTGVLKHKPTSF